jgi:hypothetical protein
MGSHEINLQRLENNFNINTLRKRLILPNQINKGGYLIFVSFSNMH